MIPTVRLGGPAARRTHQGLHFPYQCASVIMIGFVAISIIMIVVETYHYCNYEHNEIIMHYE